MGNLHCVAASAVAIPSTAEIVIATMTAFNENTPAGSNLGLATQPGGAQGVYLGGSINLTTAASATAITLRVRQQSLTGTLVGLAQVIAIAASTTGIALDIGELDPTFVQTPAIYVITAQLNAGSATVNRVLFTAEEATSFE